MHIFRKKMHFFLIFCGKNLHKWKFCINFAVDFKTCSYLEGFC